MHGHDLGVVIDAVDDPIVAAASGVQPGKLSYKRLAESLGILGDGTMQRQGSVTDLGRQTIEMGEAPRA